MSSLRQFAQREAAEVCGFASAAVDLLTEDDPAASMISAGLSGTSSTSHLPDPPGVVTIRLNYQLGLPGMLFSLLDYETDGSLVSDIHDTLSSIMASMASDNLQSWLALCREVLNDQNKPGAAATTGSGHDKIGSRSGHHLKNLTSLTTLTTQTTQTIFIFLNKSHFVYFILNFI